MQLEKVKLSLDDDGLETPLEEMSTPFVTSVEPLRVSRVQVVHPSRDVPGWSFDEEVIVIADEAIGMKSESLFEDDRAEQVEKVGPIEVVHEDRRSLVAAADHVVERAREFEA